MVTADEGLTAQAIAQEPASGSSPFVRIFNVNTPETGQLSDVTTALVELSEPGGILDANEQVEAGALALLNDPELAESNPDNPMINSGATFFLSLIHI